MFPEIEKAFGETSRLVLGSELHGLDAYGPWLSARVPMPA